MIITFSIFFVFAYLLGSINCAMIVSKLMGLHDPRQQGSGNPGATNVLRLGGKTAAILVLIGDILKGMIPVLLANWLSVHGFWLALIGFAAIAGHMFPLFFKFKGGKGVATTFGVLFSLSILLGILTLVIFLMIVGIARYVSLASICAIAASPIVTLFLGDYAAYFIPLMLIAILVTLRHKDNLMRLRDGVENKLRFGR